MYLRSTLVSFVIALGLAAYWFAFEHAKAPEDPRQTLNQDMTDLRVEQIVRIQIQSSQRPPTTLTRKPGSPDWQLDKRGPVDRKMVHAMYTALHDEKLYGQLTGDLEQFGLDQPVLTVTLVDSDDKQTVLHFGDADPSGRRRYLMRGSSSRVYLVRSRAYSAFDQQANDLRDRRVMPVNAPAKVAQVSVTQGANTWSMSRIEGGWRIDPIGDRAHSDAEAFLRRLLAGRAQAFLPDHDLPDRVATIAVRLLDQTTWTLEIGPIVPGTRSRLVRLASRAELMRVNRIHMAALLRGPQSLRDPDVLHLPQGPRQITKLSFPDLAIERSGKTWKISHGSLDSFSSLRVEDLVEALDAGKITEFLEAGQATWLTRLDIIHKGETRRLEFGSFEGKPCIKIAGRPGLMRINDRLANRLSEGPLACRSTDLLSLPPETVTRLSVADKALDPGKKRWKDLLWRLDQLQLKRFVSTPPTRILRRYSILTRDGKTREVLIGQATVGLAGGPHGVVDEAVIKGLLPALE